MHAWAEVCQSSKSVLTGFLSSCMQYWLKNHRPDQALFKHSLHTAVPTVFLIQQSCVIVTFHCKMIMHMCTREEKRRLKGSHSSSVSGSNARETSNAGKKAMAWCTAQLKMLLFCTKTIVKQSRKLELPHLKKKKEKHFGCLATFWFGTFAMLFSTHWVCCSSWKHSKMNGRLL